MKKLALENATAEIQPYMEVLSALELIIYFKLVSQNVLFISAIKQVNIACHYEIYGRSKQFITVFFF